jgi:hypothetical protein
MQRSTSRSEAALPISDRQVPSLDNMATELTAAGITIDARLFSEVALSDAVSFGGAGEQAATRIAVESRAGIWRMTAPRFAAHPSSKESKEKIVSASLVKTSIDGGYE